MIIEGNSVAECWLKVLKCIVSKSGKEISPLIIRINVTDTIPDYQIKLEKDLNKFLKKDNQPTFETTASTIFPISLAYGKTSVFDRYEKTWKEIKKDYRNKRGTYFKRFISYGEQNNKPVNQLKHIIETYNGTQTRKPVHRRSALIATVFDPAQDHTSQPQLGFPCLQQICFIPKNPKNELNMSAIYAMQHLSTRAYGNYIGLVRLGEFMAKEMGLKFTQLDCMLSILSLGSMNKKHASLLVDKYGHYV